MALDPSFRYGAGEFFGKKWRIDGGKGWESCSPDEIAELEHVQTSSTELLQSTTDWMPGHEVLEHRGLVIAAVSTMLFGKLINKQEDRLAHAADKALEELSKKALALGANAVIGIRLTANNAEGGALASNSTGVLASGTAVRVKVKSEESGAEVSESGHQM